MFTKQDIMRKVLFALTPLLLFSILLYGWRPLAVCAVSIIVAVLTEFFFEKTRKKKVSEAVLVTALLYSLSLPPLVPLWVAGIGMFFAVFFAKEVFGGFGRNIFNPAIAGRLFIYISFPSLLGSAYMVPGNFGMADAISGPTPLDVLRADPEGAQDLLALFLGFRGGSIGESSMLLILVAAAYLIFTKTAQWRLMASTLGSAALLSFGLSFFGVARSLPFLPSLMSGSILFIAVFMSTDPVTAPKKPLAQWFYGIIIGSVAILVRTFSVFPEGTSFGVLMGNVFASLLDELVPAKQGKEVKP